jgi:uncharacterized protein YjbI with pentapeptide repeats
MDNNYSYLYWAGLPIILFITALLIWLPRWQVRKQRNTLKDIEHLAPSERIQLEKDLCLAINSLRTTLAQILGGLVILGGLLATYQSVNLAQQTLNLSQESQMSERYTKAVEMLGNKNIDIRIAGIFALESIANSSKTYHWPIMELLTAFVRKTSQAPRDKDSSKPETAGTESSSDLSTNDRLSEDIQLVMIVIGRRKWVETETKTQVLDFRHSILIGVDLANGDFRRANFAYVKFGKQRLVSIDTTAQSSQYLPLNISESNLREADLSNANLNSTILDNVSLANAKLTGATLQAASMLGTDLRGANLEGANLVSALSVAPGNLANAGNRNGIMLSQSMKEKLDAYTASLQTPAKENINTENK